MRVLFFLYRKTVGGVRMGEVKVLNVPGVLWYLPWGIEESSSEKWKSFRDAKKLSHKLGVKLIKL